MNSEHDITSYPSIRQVIIVILLTIGIVLLLGLIGTMLGATRELYLLEAVVILPALLFTYKNRFSAVTLFRLRGVNSRVVLISIIIGLGIAVVTDEIDRIVEIFFPMPDAVRQAIEAALKIESNSDLIIIVVSSVIFAAIVEEMLFRGFVQTSFEHHFDTTKAVMSSALLFAVIHFNPWWLIQVIIIGVILGVMAWKSDSIIPPIIVHFINNSLAIVFVNLSPEQIRWYLRGNHVQIPIVLAAIIVTVWGMKLFYEFTESHDSGHLYQ